MRRITSADRVHCFHLLSLLLYGPDVYEGDGCEYWNGDSGALSLCFGEVCHMANRLCVGASL